MAIIGIVAIAKNYAIGKDGKLPWHHSADLKFFKETTAGHAVVMGSNTWRSISKPLPGRLNVVLSHSRMIDAAPDVIGLGSIDEVVELSKQLDKDIFIIGGAKTYEEFAGLIDRWIVTEVPDAAEDADIFMPAGFLDEFVEDGRRNLGDGLVVRSLHRK